MAVGAGRDGHGSTGMLFMKRGERYQQATAMQMEGDDRSNGESRR
jgi:hypothetical protein